MKNKFGSLTAVTLLYVIALGAAAGFTVLLNPVIESRILLLFLADVSATVVIFIFGLIFKNASVYDPYWSVAPPFLAAGYYIVSNSAFSLLHLWVLIPLAFWSVRLTYNWAKGFSDLKWQDWRYTNLKSKHPRLYPVICFLGIMLMPTVLVFGGMIPLFTLIAGTANLWFCIAGGAVILFAAFYQALADAQLRRFRNNPARRGQTIDSGLWRFSRHPNYFGEILIWWGVLLSALPNIFWPMFFGAVLISCLFFFISVPMMEKHILEKHPEYSTYRQNVPSPIIPFMRKEADENSEAPVSL